MEHLEAVEDAVQNALVSALEAWTTAGLPDDPSAWVYRVAHNGLVGELRQRGVRRRILDAAATEPQDSPTGPGAQLAGEMRDDLLRMLFVCCDEALPTESRLALALKTLCGFDVREIASRLFTTDANVYKRLERSRNQLKAVSMNLEGLSLQQYSTRIPSVLTVLYLLFTEGYLSAHAETAIRRELCDEAIRLATILAEHPVGGGPETCALLALMHFHAARIIARQDASGGLVLLEEQDRSCWDQEQIRTGLSWLAASARGDVYSRFHAEAAIAAEHCLAPSFDETRWEKVVECYELLEHLAPSSLHKLNCAVAVAELRGPLEGLAVLEGCEPPSWLAGSYQWSAVLADLHRRAGHDSIAVRYREIALQLAPTEAVRVLLVRRLQTNPPRSRSP